MNLNDLATFVHVAELGTYAATARAEGVPRSTVSRRVARLEEELGVALLRRSARTFVLTDEGRILHDRAAPALREITRVERDLEGAAPEGRLALTLPIDLATSGLMARLLTEFRAAHPAIDVSLTITNRSVDLLEEGVDLALRMHTRPLPSRDDLVVRSLLRGTYGLYAAPSYVRTRDPLGTMEAVMDGPTLGHATAWRDTWLTEPTVVADDFAPLLALAVAGAGVAGLPDFLAEDAISDGRLQRVAPSDGPGPAEERAFRLSAVWLRTRHLAGRVRAFVDVAVAALEEHRGRPDAR